MLRESLILTQYMQIPSLQTQPAFQERNLIPKEDFCKFCEENGITVTEEDLEALHREGILYPTVKVELGYSEFRKIYAVFDEQTKEKEWRFVHHGHEDRFPTEKVDNTPYYSTGSLNYGGHEWLKWYKGDVNFPSALPYFPWKTREHAWMVTNKKKADGMYELMYDKYQFLAVRIIRDSITHDSDLFPVPLKKIRKDRMRQRLHELYVFLRFYFDVRDMHARWIDKGYETYASIKKTVGEKNVKEEWDTEFLKVHLPAMKKEAKAILKAHKMRKDDVFQWIHFLAGQSLLSRHTQTKPYLAEVEEKTLTGSELTNTMIHVLNEFLYALDKDRQTVKAVLEHTVLHCIICRRAYTPKPNVKKPLTCGESDCVDEQKNIQKKLKRSQKVAETAPVADA